MHPTIWLLASICLTSLLLGSGCSRLPGAAFPHPIPQIGGATALPDTTAQQILVRTYVHLLAAERFAEAWALLTPERQRRESVAVFEAAWRARGQVRAAPDIGPNVWPGTEEEMRAEVWLERPQSRGLRELDVRVRRIDGKWRIAAEESGDHRAPLPIQATTPEQATWKYVAWVYGPMYLSTIDILAQEPFDDGQIVVFRALNPLPEKWTGLGARPTATLLYVRRAHGEWRVAGGGSIGTIVQMDRWPVACAWTWIRYWPQAPTVAAFYCTIEDPRVATIELTRVDGAIERAEIAGRRAVVFPYPWDLRFGWPTQQPQALRLFDAAGNLLDLPTSPLAAEVAAMGIAPPENSQTSNPQAPADSQAPDSQPRIASQSPVDSQTPRPGPSPIPFPLPPVDPAALAARDTFPPLVMTWRETRRMPTPTEYTVSQTFRLEYTSLCRYRFMQLEHEPGTDQPANPPRSVGGISEADGRTVRSYDASRTPSELVTPLDPRNCLTPEEHLMIPVAMPASVRTLASLPFWEVTDLGDGLARLSREEAHPGAGGGVRERVEVTYRTADNLPVLVVSTANGVEVQRREVLELRVDGR